LHSQSRTSESEEIVVGRLALPWCAQHKDICQWRLRYSFRALCLAHCSGKAHTAGFAKSKAGQSEEQPPALKEGTELRRQVAALLAGWDALAISTGAVRPDGVSR
jgi:hypothetical protein